MKLYYTLGIEALPECDTFTPFTIKKNSGGVFYLWKVYWVTLSVTPSPPLKVEFFSDIVKNKWLIKKVLTWSSSLH